DRFVVLSKDQSNGQYEEMIVQWPGVDLTDETRAALARLLSGLTYLGRAESWCDARLLPEPASFQPNCVPATDGGVPVLVPDPEGWSGWDYSKKIRRPEPAWNLLAETADVQAARWTIPPGAMWTRYRL